jgi:DNA-binding CsgD family transcriptional regulator
LISLEHYGKGKALLPYAQGATIKLPSSFVGIDEVMADTGLALPQTSILMEFIYHQIYRQNSNLIVLCEGLPGLGKSITSAGIGERWSDFVGLPFTVKHNFSHTIPELLQRISELQLRHERGETTRGIVLQYDDAGVTMDSRKWQDEMHKALNDSLEVMRYLGVVLFITVPSRTRIDKKMRDLAHATLKIMKKKEGEYTLCKFYLNSKHWKTGEDIFTLLRAQHKGWVFKVDLVKVKPASIRVRRDYEEWMLQFKGNIIKRSFARIQKKSNEVAVEQRKNLTERQRQILMLLKGQNTPGMIATQLGISEAGVSTHIRNIRAKGWI